MIVWTAAAICYLAIGILLSRYTKTKANDKNSFFYDPDSEEKSTTLQQGLLLLMSFLWPMFAVIIVVGSAVSFVWVRLAKLLFGDLFKSNRVIGN